MALEHLVCDGTLPATAVSFAALAGVDVAALAGVVVAVHGALPAAVFVLSVVTSIPLGSLYSTCDLLLVCLSCASFDVLENFCALSFDLLLMAAFRYLPTTTCRGWQ